MSDLDLPELPARSARPALPEPPETPIWFFEPPKKFRHRYWIHVLLFLATLASTTYVGRTSLDWRTGLWYAIPILVILTAHEFGHYIACRIHDVDATLPYFLPMPFLPLTGTLGAVIRIRESFPSKQALFDIGVAGPIAGFVALLPFLFWGVHTSEIFAIDPHAPVLWLGEPLLFQLAKWMSFGAIPAGHDLTISSMGFAAWFGLLATALNLMPFGQLDGGHIAYAVFGPKARYISMATLALAIGLTIWSLSWLAMTIMLVVMAWFLGFRHPRIIDEQAPLDPRRRVIAGLALIIFIISFTPVPIAMLFEG